MGNGSFKDARSHFAMELDRVLNLKRRHAFARFHDGEYALLRGEPYRARSGWRVDGPTWLQRPLEDALAYRAPGYIVGISPPCDLPRECAWYRGRTRGTRASRDLTYATLFMHSNYPAARAKLSAMLDAGAVLVSCKGGDVKVPTGVHGSWDIDEIVRRLASVDRPILLCCGPAAAVIVHRYCLAVAPELRQPIIDAGATLDHRIHGKATREYQRDASALRQHVCKLDHWQPWAKKYKNPNEERKARMLRASRQASSKRGGHQS